MAVDIVARTLAAVATQGSQLSESIVVSKDIGEIEAGTEFPEGSSISEIIEQMLNGGGEPAPSRKYDIYGGSFTDYRDFQDIDTQLSPLKTDLSESELLDPQGIEIKMVVGDSNLYASQYLIVAIPAESGEAGTTISEKYFTIKSLKGKSGCDLNLVYITALTTGRQKYRCYRSAEKFYDVNYGGTTYDLKINARE